GATWFGKYHPQFFEFLNELEIEAFEQKMGNHAVYESISTSPPQLVTLPANEQPSYRVKSGTFSVISALLKKLDKTAIYYEQIVESIEFQNSNFKIKTDKAEFESSFVISTLPPYLLTKSIVFKPDLPQELMEVTSKTHTWMAESIKVGLTYETPFWRQANSSATIFSNVGPITEMYDHSNFKDEAYGLKGFVNSSYFSISKKERLELILQQLTRYYGQDARSYKSYEETVWRNEPFTFTEYESPLFPHQNNGHVAYSKPYFDNQFIIAGAETASSFPGYMEGAISSAKSAFELLKELLKDLKRES
ncbi:MAG: monoamine oxidase, partial [Limisphaerales bacterium]